MSNSDVSRLSSVDNALLLVRLLVEHRVLRVSEAADLLGVAPSTAHRLLVSLCAQGFAEHDPRGPYQPGPVLLEIGHTVTSGLDLRAACRPALERLAERTDETISLCVLEGHDVRFIDGIDGRQLIRVGDRRGVRLPAHATAGGKAIMAALSDYELERRFGGRGLERRTGQTVSDWHTLLEELTAIRHAGFAMNVREGSRDACAIGAAVLDRVGAPLASINVVMPAVRMPEKQVRTELVNAVMDAAASASKSVRDWR